MKLRNDQTFPTLQLASVDGRRLTIPDDLGREWAAVLFYRGHWWGFCRQQLAGYQNELELLHRLDVDVVALSVDGEEDASGTVERLDLGFPVLYGADPDDAADRFGAYVHDDGYLQPVGFLLRSGEIHQVTYSSGPLGRLRPEEVEKWVQYMRDRS